MTCRADNPRRIKGARHKAIGALSGSGLDSSLVVVDGGLLYASRFHDRQLCTSAAPRLFSKQLLQRHKTDSQHTQHTHDRIIACRLNIPATHSVCLADPVPVHAAAQVLDGQQNCAGRRKVFGPATGVDSCETWNPDFPSFPIYVPTSKELLCNLSPHINLCSSCWKLDVARAHLQVQPCRSHQNPSSSPHIREHAAPHLSG